MGSECKKLFEVALCLIPLECRKELWMLYLYIDNVLTRATNTKSLAKEFSKILIFEYFGHLKIGLDVFFDADFESSRMT